MRHSDDETLVMKKLVVSTYNGAARHSNVNGAWLKLVQLKDDPDIILLQDFQSKVFLEGFKTFGADRMTQVLVRDSLPAVKVHAQGICRKSGGT